MTISLKRTLFFSFLTGFILYSAYVYNSGTEGVTIIDKNAKRGKTIYQEKNCVSCHQLYGLGGYMGPDLTNVISDPKRGKNYAKAFILNGTLKMPDFGLTEDEANCLIAYLTEVDRTGKSPNRNYTIEVNGNVSFQ